MGMGTTQLLGMTGDTIGAHSSDAGMIPRQDLSTALEATQKTPGGEIASLEAHNRLKHSVPILQSEMESMQHDSRHPFDLSLKSELSSFEQDVQRANQYIEVLQAQISAESSAEI